MSLWQRIVNWFQSLVHPAPVRHENNDGLWWTDADKNGQVHVGLTTDTVDTLENVTFLDTPRVGKTVEDGDQLVDVEGGKAVQTMTTPVAGKIESVNQHYQDDPASLTGQKDPELLTISPK